MSTKIASKIWSLRGIPSTTKLIIVKLADNASDEGICWPSVLTVAADCEVNVRTVQRTIIWAEKFGLLTCEKRPGRSSVYRITPDNFSPPPPAESHPRHIVTPDTVVTPTPDTGVTTTPDNHDIAYIEEPSFEPSFEPSDSRPSEELLKQAVGMWNEMAKEIGLAEVQKLTGQRKTKLRARLRDCGGLDGWAVALAKIRGSPFLRGEKTAWKADFDFVLQEKSFTKMMEGAYDASRNATPPWGGQPKLTPAERIVAAALGAGCGP